MGRRHREPRDGDDLPAGNVELIRRGGRPLRDPKAVDEVVLGEQPPELQPALMRDAEGLWAAVRGVLGPLAAGQHLGVSVGTAVQRS